MNLYSHRKVTPYFVPLQTFWLLFLQLIATIVPIGDKSGQLPQNLTYHNVYFIFFLKICLSFEIIHYLCTIQIINVEDMEFNNELLDQIIDSAEFLKALSMSVEVGEYKGWKVRVSLEKPNSKLNDMHVI